MARGASRKNRVGERASKLHLLVQRTHTRTHTPFRLVTAASGATSPTAAGAAASAASAGGAPGGAAAGPTSPSAAAAAAADAKKKQSEAKSAEELKGLDLTPGGEEVAQAKKDVIRYLLLLQRNATHVAGNMQHKAPLVGRSCCVLLRCAAAGCLLPAAGCWLLAAALFALCW